MTLDLAAGPLDGVAATTPLADPAAMAADRALLEEFVVTNVDYYASAFQRLNRSGVRGVTPNWSALLLGPFWGGARGLWGWTMAAVAVETVAFIWIAQGLFGTADMLLPGLVLLGASKVTKALTANWAYQRRFSQWRMDRQPRPGLSLVHGVAAGIFALFVWALTAYRAAAPQVPEFLETFPTARGIHRTTAGAIDAGKDWLVINFAGFFDSITRNVRMILELLEALFVGTPWPVMAAVLLLVAWRVAGWRVALFTGVGLAYLGLFGFWESAMSTIALVGASVFICFLFGVPLGIWAAKRPRVDSTLRPVLDLMQTMPSFVYLIPAIAFFSVGKVPGILATVIFAMPPMIRLTTLGIQQVPTHVKEAAVAFGASPAQLLVKVELPLAVPSIMTGINQTIMMGLSMVVVAALIGAGGLGYEVYRSLRHVETGNGMLAGVAIAFCAMILDRIVQGSRARRRER